MTTYKLLAGSLVLLFVSCNQNQHEKAGTQNIQEVKLADVKPEEQMRTDTTAPVPPTPGEPKQKNSLPASSKFPESKPDWNKKIIKTATLNIEVKDYKTFNGKVAQAANQFGGYIAGEQQNETAYKIENVVTVKVPVDQFQNAVDFLTTGDGKINEKKITSEDVTTQFIDTRSRLEAKKQVRLRYLDFLKQARNMEEMLQVQNEINDIQEEIESATGRINYISGASAMSTIQLTFYQVLNATAKDNDKISFWQKTKIAFVSGWQGVGEVFVGLMYIWPLLIVIIAGIWVMRKRFQLQKKAAA
jgi:hypothetical protein